MDETQAPIQANEPAVQAMPGPLPRLPGRPPAEPIVIVHDQDVRQLHRS